MANASEQSVMEQELAALITSRTICFKWDISEDTLSRLMKNDPSFPRPVTLTFGARSAAPRRFILAEVQAYFQNKIMAQRVQA